MGNREWGIATLAARWLGFVNARCGGRGARRTRAVARGVLGARVSAHVAPISARVPGKSRALVPLMWVCKRGVFGFALVSKGVASASSRHTSAITPCEKTRGWRTILVGSLRVTVTSHNS